MGTTRRNPSIATVKIRRISTIHVAAIATAKLVVGGNGAWYATAALVPQVQLAESSPFADVKLPNVVVPLHDWAESLEVPTTSIPNRTRLKPSRRITIYPNSGRPVRCRLGGCYGIGGPDQAGRLSGGLQHRPARGPRSCSSGSSTSRLSGSRGTAVLHRRIDFRRRTGFNACPLQIVCTHHRKQLWRCTRRSQ